MIPGLAGSFPLNWWLTRLRFEVPGRFCGTMADLATPLRIIRGKPCTLRPWQQKVKRVSATPCHHSRHGGSVKARPDRQAQAAAELPGLIAELLQQFLADPLLLCLGLRGKFQRQVGDQEGRFLVGYLTGLRWPDFRQMPGQPRFQHLLDLVPHLGFIPPNNPWSPQSNIRSSNRRVEISLEFPRDLHEADES